MSLLRSFLECRGSPSPLMARLRVKKSSEKFGRVKSIVAVDLNEILRGFDDSISEQLELEDASEFELGHVTLLCQTSLRNSITSQAFAMHETRFYDALRPLSTSTASEGARSSKIRRGKVTERSVTYRESTRANPNHLRVRQPRKNQAKTLAAGRVFCRKIGRRRTAVGRSAERGCSG